MTRALLIIIFSAIFNCVFAQHDHSKDNNRNWAVLFITQNDQYKAEVESDANEFYVDSLYNMNLIITSLNLIDSASVKLNITKNENTQNLYYMRLINGKYSTEIKFHREGKHVLEFTFNMISDDRTVKNFSFSFNTSVKNNNHDNMQHNEGMMGMMGMGSTGFWLIMAGIMVAMMAVIMVLNSHK